MRNQAAMASSGASSNQAPVTRFDEEKVNGFLAKKDRVGLVAYLQTFLFLNQQDDKYLHSHPGLFFIVYKGWLLDMIERKSFEYAKALFYDKVEPLLLCDDHNLFRSYVTTGVLPSQGELTTVRTIKTALVDYIHLPHGEERN